MPFVDNTQARVIHAHAKNKQGLDVIMMVLPGVQAVESGTWEAMQEHRANAPFIKAGWLKFEKNKPSEEQAKEAREKLADQKPTLDATKARAVGLPAAGKESAKAAK